MSQYILLYNIFLYFEIYIISKKYHAYRHDFLKDSSFKLNYIMSVWLAKDNKGRLNVVMRIQSFKNKLHTRGHQVTCFMEQLRLLWRFERSC